MRTEIHKFGGTSVGDAARIARAAELAHEASARGRLVVVSSAMSGVTNALVALAAATEVGDETTALDAVARLREAHLGTLADLALPDRDDHAALLSNLSSLFSDLDHLVRASLSLGELSPRTRDRILAGGEKLAVRLVAAALRARGVDAPAMDADRFLETDAHFGSANPIGGVADRHVMAALGPLLDRGAIPVVTGFCGRAPDGATTTLGRGASDFTATLLAAATDADAVCIWSDVDGVFSADPRLVADARVIRQLHYREAAEMSYFGAKVLHQRTMIPVARKRIPVLMRSSFRPDAPGTRVDGRFTPGSHPVKAVTAVRGHALLSIEGKGMAGVPGIAARVFGTLAEHRISVTMISQSSSESSICLAVPESLADRAEQALKRAMATDMSRGDVEEIAVRRGVALIAAVGLGMAEIPGVAARVFGALGAQGVNILAIAQGSSELNISFAVGTPDVAAATRAVHAEFRLDRLDTGEDAPRSLDLLLLGCGNVGRELIAQIEARRTQARARFGLTPRVVAICDRSGYVFDPTGVDPDELASHLAGKAAGRPLVEMGGLPGDPTDMLRAALAWRLSHPVLVDVSDSDEGAAAFELALELGCDIATANKKPLAGDLSAWRRTSELAASRGLLLKAEATVGAGLPVVDTLEMLLHTGDRLKSAQGCFSGTLGYLVSQLGRGVPMSEAVASAVRLGYTEPDPVEDLAGGDVARKAVILGRLSGLVRDERPVQLEGFVDPRWKGMDHDALFARIRDELDEPMAARVAAAAQRDHVIRFAATVDAEGIRVGPTEVPRESPLGGLRGSDNLVVFRSDRYDERPLVITGPGAGGEVTAMGVLGDIFRIAAERA